MKEPIESGQTWRQRNGQTVEITSIVPADHMPVKSGERCWQSNGRYWSDTFEDKRDLMERVK